MQQILFSRETLLWSFIKGEEKKKKSQPNQRQAWDVQTIKSLMLYRVCPLCFKLPVKQPTPTGESTAVLNVLTNQGTITNTLLSRKTYTLLRITARVKHVSHFYIQGFSRRTTDDWTEDAPRPLWLLSWYLTRHLCPSDVTLAFPTFEKFASPHCCCWFAVCNISLFIILWKREAAVLSIMQASQRVNLLLISQCHKCATEVK